MDPETGEIKILHNAAAQQTALHGIEKILAVHLGPKKYESLKAVADEVDHHDDLDGYINSATEAGKKAGKILLPDGVSGVKASVEVVKDNGKEKHRMRMHRTKDTKADTKVELVADTAKSPAPMNAKERLRADRAAREATKAGTGKGQGTVMVNPMMDAGDDK